MSILQAIRNNTLSFVPKFSNNNRKMTPGRIHAGKSTFKGTEVEHELVKVEKFIKERSRMVFAIDIKLHSNDSYDNAELKGERTVLMDELINAIDFLEEVSSQNRFQQFMQKLDQEDVHRRKVRDIPEM